MPRRLKPPQSRGQKRMEVNPLQRRNPKWDWGGGELTSCDLSWRLSFSFRRLVPFVLKGELDTTIIGRHFLFGIKPILLLFRIDLMDICGSNIVVLTWYPISWDLSPGPYHLCESNIFLLLLYVPKDNRKGFPILFLFVVLSFAEERKVNRGLTGNFRLLFFCFVFFFKIGARGIIQ